MNDSDDCLNINAKREMFFMHSIFKIINTKVDIKCRTCKYFFVKKRNYRHRYNYRNKNIYV